VSTRSRPRIAMFTPYFPAPAFTGGRMRIQHFARALSQHGELHLFAQAPLREAEDPRASAETACYASIQSAPARVLLPHASVPRRVRAGSPARLLAQFRAQHAREAFDVLVVEHAHAAAAALGCKVPWLLDEHNVESQYLQSKLQAAGKLGFWQLPELRSLRRWEARCWRAASSVVAVSAEDAERIAAVSGKAPVEIPNGVSADELPFVPPAARSGANVLFVGLMNHPPNVHAARWLAHSVMPLVWAERPDARLVLCGANPARDVSELEGPRVSVTGRVPSVQPYLSEARVFANGLAYGGGSSLKVLEALASGVPLVSTRVGVRGFALTHERHYLAAETPAQFARAVLACLNAPQDGTAQRVASGRAFAEAHGWRALSERFAQLVLGLAEAGASPEQRRSSPARTYV
jgi:glycosyltransferase involved in cell wall biosynthesis